jgi:hypothetical protein
MDERDDELVSEILALTLAVNPNNLGDNYVQAVELYRQIRNVDKQQLGEYYVAQIRSLARQAEIGWKVFAAPPNAPRPLSEDEQIRLVTIIATLHAFCYGVERLDEASFVTGPGSTPVRFYINSLYHYIAALYLLEKGGDPIGGMVFKTLAPMGLSDLLNQVKTVLDKPMEGGISFGETIRKIRNGFLVHGSFSPDDVATIVKMTQLRDMTQVIHLTNLIWELFNQSFILKLKLIALLTASGVNLDDLMKKFIAKASTP